MFQSLKLALAFQEISNQPFGVSSTGVGHQTGREHSPPVGWDDRRAFAADTAQLSMIRELCFHLEVIKVLLLLS